jgi:hypothetical protein
VRAFASNPPFLCRDGHEALKWWDENETAVCPACTLRARVAALEAEREAFADRAVRAALAIFVNEECGGSSQVPYGPIADRAIAAVKAARGER